jgi:hypothetical protein
METGRSGARRQTRRAVSLVIVRRVPLPCADAASDAIREKIANLLGPALGQPVSYGGTKPIERNRLRLVEQTELRRSNHIGFG